MGTAVFAVVWCGEAVATVWELRYGKVCNNSNAVRRYPLGVRTEVRGGAVVACVVETASAAVRPVRVRRDVPPQHAGPRACGVEGGAALNGMCCLR